MTPPAERARAFGLIGVAFGLGFVVGPAIGGLLGGFDPRLPFWVAAGLCLANVAFGWFVLPESLPPERRMAFAWRRANPLGSLKLLRSHRELFGLATVDFLGHLAHQVLPAVFVLYALHRYGWTEAGVGLTLAGVGVGSAVVQGALVGPLVAPAAASADADRRPAGRRLGMAIYGLAPTGAIFWLGIPVMAVWGLSGPAVQGLMTRLVSPSEQGQLQGASAGLMAISGLIGPGIFVRVSTFAYPGVGLPAGRAVAPGRRRPSLGDDRGLGRYEAAAIRRPTSVSLQTSQSGFSGLLNQGSAQPHSKQRRTTAASTAWPSRSNNGSLPPGWVSARRK